jgi:uncharacterized protein (DUF4415 family)
LIDRVGNDRGRLNKAASHIGGRDSIDPDEAPELTDEFFEGADWYKGDVLVRRGRPRSANPKRRVTLRIDADVIEHFRATGPGWQTRANEALRKAAKLGKRSARISRH